MNTKTTRLLLIGLIVIAGGAYWYSHQKESASSQNLGQQVSSETLGTYAYECDEHVAFTLMPAADMSTVVIAPVEGRPYPPTVTLAKMPSASGVRYEGGEITLTARGETVTLNEGGEVVINCSPTPAAGEAPFNFGD